MSFLYSSNFTQQQHGPIDPEVFKKSQVVEALWAELMMSEQLNVSSQRKERSVDEKSAIKMYLRDQFPKIKWSVINELIERKDFYQAILILGLCEHIDCIENLQERLKKFQYLPNAISSVLNEPNVYQSRRKEVLQGHKATLPEFAENAWAMYLQIMDINYLAELEKMTMFECSICCEKFERQKGIHCTQNDFELPYEPHFFCTDCSKGHAMTDTSLCGTKGRGVKCPEMNCKGVILEAYIIPLLSPTEQEAFRKRTFNAAIIETKIENLEKCKRCGYPIVIDFSKEARPVFQCENSDCLYKFCRICERVYDERHEGIECDKVLTDHDEARLKLEEQLVLITIRKCKKCGLEFTRNGGCNKMTCTNCGTTQCYLCKTSEVTYDHFKAEKGGKCVLYTNDNEVNARDENERQNFLRQAKDKRLLEEDKAKLK